MKEELSERCKSKIMANRIKNFLNERVQSTVGGHTTYSHCRKEETTRFMFHANVLVDDNGDFLICEVPYMAKLTRIEYSKWFKSKIINTTSNPWHYINDEVTFNNYRTKPIACINKEQKIITIYNKRYYNALKEWGDKHKYKKLVKDWC